MLQNVKIIAIIIIIITANQTCNTTVTIVTGSCRIREYTA